MKKLTNFVMGFLLIAVIVLSITAGYLLTKDNGGVSVDPALALTTFSAQNESSNEFEDGSAEPENEITGLRCSVQLGALDIVEGEDFNVSELNGSDYEAYVENGTYIVKGSATHDNHIMVTIPKDFQFQNVELVVTGGALTAENIDTLNLHTNCDKGAINYSGSVNVDAEIQQLQGKTVLNINGKQTDYYSLDINLGHIGIDEQQYAGIDQYQSIDNSAEKTINAYCTMGSVGILFSESN